MSREFSIHFEVENAAFYDEDKHAPATEVAQILEEVARKVENGYTGGKVQDMNGNTIGEWFFEVEDEEDEE